MYVWQAVKTSGGGIIYARTLMKQKEHARSYSALQGQARPSLTHAQAKWDFFEEFDPQVGSASPNDDFSDASSSKPGSPLRGPAPINAINVDNLDLQCSADAQLQLDAANDPLNSELQASAAMIEGHSPQRLIRRALNGVSNQLDGFSTGSTDVSRTIEMAHWQFGFMPPLGQEFKSSSMRLGWKEVLQILGSTDECSENVGCGR